MTALTASRVPPEIMGRLFTIPVAAAKKIYRGALIVLDSSGNAEPATTATGKRALGVALEYADNTDGAAGDITVDVRTGIFGFANSSAGDAITAAEIGHTCYIVDDQTVAKTSGGGTRSPAGCIKMIDQDGLVLVDVGMPSSIDGDLVAANNLSDVADAATARANIGANKVVIGPLHVGNLKGADAKVYRVVSPVAGTLKTIRSVIDHALATGDATLTTKINAGAVTNGVVTITSPGAAGDADVATATAANTVAVGDVLSVTVGGTNTDADATAEVTFYIET